MRFPTSFRLNQSSRSFESVLFESCEDLNIPGTFARISSFGILTTRKNWNSWAFEMARFGLVYPIVLHDIALFMSIL